MAPSSPGDTTPPDNVTGFTAMLGDGQVVLSWSNPSDLDLAGVRVCWNPIAQPADPGVCGASLFDVAAPGAGTTISGLTNGQLYFFTAFAYDNSGVTNYADGATAQASATPQQALTAPDAATGLVATGGDGLVDLGWTTALGGEPPTGYKVFRGTVAGVSVAGTPLATVSVPATIHADFFVNNGVTYFYKVVSFNGMGDGPESNEDSATPQAPLTAPDAATGLAATGGDGFVDLVWSAPATGTAVSGYKVFRDTATGVPVLGTPLATVSTTTYQDTTVTNGIPYFFKVVSYNSAGDGPESNEDSATPADTTPPGNVTVFTATAGDGQVVLAWTNPSDADFAGVRVCWSTAAQPTDPTACGVDYVDVAAPATGTTVSPLTNGQTYYFTAFAYDNATPPPNYADGTTAQDSAVPVAPADYIDSTTGMEFVSIPGGSFEMGCGAWTSSCYPDETPRRTVTLAGFWLGRYEVTQGQWLAVMGSNPSGFQNGDNFPVETVSWDDVQAFITQLNAQSSAIYRLPSEAEWEYACRSGGAEVMYGTAADALSASGANYNDNVGQTSAVGS